MRKCCIEISNKTKDGEIMRPRRAPENWSQILYDIHKGVPGLKIDWWRGNGPQLIIDRRLRDDNNVFTHIMNFIKLHNIDYIIDYSECSKCKGHKHCIANNEKVKMK